MWIVPSGTTFKAVQPPKYNQLTEFTADDDLALVYKGSLVEMEIKANNKAFKAADQARTKGVVLGGVGSLLALLAALAGKSLMNKIGQKTKKT